MDISINYLAVLVAAISQMVVGTFWYGPLFGKPWMAGMKFTPADMEAAQRKGMGSTYLMALVNSLVMAYVAAHFIELLGITTAGSAVAFAFLIWLGFYVTLLVGTMLWEGKSKTLFAIGAGYYLVNLVVTVLILTVWN